MPGKWKKKPVVVEAVRFNGDNVEEIKEFVGDNLVTIITGVYSVKTLEGKMMVSKGDYVIKGVKGEFYPCKPDIFHATYEKHLVWEDNI
jgi:hypothetical protein